MNRAVLMGRLTKDVDLRETTSGKRVARYTLAIDRSGKSENTDFIPCVVWNKSAEWAGKYLRKGMRICVEGRIETGSYETAEGSRIYTMVVNVRTQEFADKPEPKEESPDRINEGFEPDEEHLPFN